MPTEHLKANLMALLNDLNKKSPPKKKDPIIWRLTVLSAPGMENFKLDLFELLGIVEDATAPKENKPAAKEEKPSEEEEDEQVAAKQ